jgi:hypothetical protein
MKVTLETQKEKQLYLLVFPSNRNYRCTHLQVQDISTGDSSHMEHTSDSRSVPTLFVDWKNSTFAQKISNTNLHMLDQATSTSSQAEGLADWNQWEQVKGPCNYQNFHSWLKYILEVNITRQRLHRFGLTTNLPSVYSKGAQLRDLLESACFEFITTGLEQIQRTFEILLVAM